jgi:hypothetical protein
MPLAFDAVCSRTYHCHYYKQQPPRLPPRSPPTLTTTITLTATTTARPPLAATTLKRRLIKALVPSNDVPVQLCLRVIAALNPSTLEPNNFRLNKSGIKTLMLKWIIMVYDLVDRKERLHAMYGVLFLYLGYVSSCLFVTPCVMLPCSSSCTWGTHTPIRL